MSAAFATPKSQRSFPLVEGLWFRVSAMSPATHGLQIPSRANRPLPSCTRA